MREATLPGFIRPATLSTIGGRTEAWSGAIHLIGQRPLAGFGLGNELRSIHLYRDGGFRLYNECLGMPAAWLHAPLPDACETLVPHSRRLFDFSGDNAHQSFLGLGIQLGAVFLAAAALALVVAAVRLALLVRRRDGLEAACFAGVVTGLGLALVETYLFSPGNAVAGPFWLLLVIGLAAPARRRVPA